MMRFGRGLLALLAGFGVHGCAPDADPVGPMDRMVAAIAADSVEAVLLMLTEGVAPNDTSSGGVLPLHAAVAAGSDTLVGELLRSGADPSRIDASGLRAYDIAFRSETPRVALRLVENAIQAAGAGAAVDTWMTGVREGRAIDTPRWHEVLSGELLSLGLMYLAFHQRTDRFGPMRRAREIPNRTGYHALAVAARWGYTDVVRSLLAIDVHPNLATADPGGATPLSLARLGGHEGIVALLLRAGARPSE